MNLPNARSAWLMRGGADSRVGGAESVTVPTILLASALLVSLAPLQAEAAPEGCSDAEPDVYTCRWVLSGVKPGEAGFWELPMFEAPALATFTVTLTQSLDQGWQLQVQRKRAGSDEWEVASESLHPGTTQLSNRHQSQSTHVLEGNPGDAWRVEFHPGHRDVSLVGDGFASGQGVGTYEVAYLARILPPGAKPSRPAATPDDPQIEDLPGEVSEPAWDLRAAWFDDARLEDGLFDVHLRVGSLENITLAAFRANSIPAGAADSQVDMLMWKVSWVVEGGAYFVEWAIPRGAPVDWDAMRCALKREPATEGGEEEVLAHPLCRVDVANATLHADVPIASIGSPPDGALFEALEARTRVRYTGNAKDVPDDTPGGLRYQFALGGPAVWSALNPRLDPPPTPWYEDPLAPENIADTVQLGGALVAVSTFLVGLVLVRGRQRQTARLLARVDAVEERGIDSADVLLRLGELEQEFNGLFRRHRISDAQYQVLTQRIAGVATRFSLRRSLGLDDGTPGEQGPSQARRVPVVESDARVRP